MIKQKKKKNAIFIRAESESSRAEVLPLCSFEARGSNILIIFAAFIATLLLLNLISMDAQGSPLTEA